MPIGTVGVVVDTDWLGDLRVKFTLGGAWFAGKCTVEKLVTPCEIRPAPSRNCQPPATDSLLPLTASRH